MAKPLTAGLARVLVIPDLQAPFHHFDTLNFLTAVYKRYKCNRVVCIGDLADFYTCSRFMKYADAESRTQEDQRTMGFLRELYRAFPNAIEMESNHQERLQSVFDEGGIISRWHKRYEEIMEFPSGWSIENHVIIDDVRYEHGHRFGGRNAAEIVKFWNASSTVIGHLHGNFSITYQRIPKTTRILFGMCVGCLIDKDAYAFRYATRDKAGAMLGTGVVLEGHPMLVRMDIDSQNRWTGKLP